MTLSGEEFLRRFLIHVLPKGLVKIRSYGFLANRCRRKQLALCRRLLGAAPPAATEPRDNADCLPVCPTCGRCEWRAIELLAGGLEQEHSPAIEDSS
jgi:hypothetical protein